jgi:hypothetical protein
VPRLTDWADSGIAMFPNTAFAAVCSGAALILAVMKRPWGALQLKSAAGLFNPAAEAMFGLSAKEAENTVAGVRPEHSYSCNIYDSKPVTFSKWDADFAESTL